MEIPLNVQVECTNGVCGRLVYVLVDPLVDTVTNLVVKETSSPNTEYIVPVDVISATIADTIQLRCSKAELEKMDPFVHKEYITEKLPGGKKDVIVPASAMDDNGNDTLFLNIDKYQVESLPIFPMHRLWA